MSKEINIDDYLDELEKKVGRSEYMDGWNESTWQEEMESHPFFAKAQYEPNEELSPLMQGLQQLKYSPGIPINENSAFELAENYKEEGNRHFGLKKYRFAIASYSEALKHARRMEVEQQRQLGNEQGEGQEESGQQQGEEESALVEARLLSNRAAAQYHLGNLRSALIDCRLALTKKPQHIKAIVKGAQCALRLSRFDECLELCSKGLNLPTSLSSKQKDDLKSIETEAKLKKKEADRDARKENLKLKKRAEDEKILYETLVRRGVIKNDDETTKDDWTFETLESKHPTRLRVRWETDEEEKSTIEGDCSDLRRSKYKLVWPILFVYPEYGQTDLIEHFDENNTFDQHLEVMFEESPAWDSHQKYCVDSVKVYFEDTKTQTMIEVDKTLTLRQALKHPRLRVRDGMPTFVVLSDKSSFQKSFLEQYNP